MRFAATLGRVAAIAGCVTFIGWSGRSLNARYDRARRMLDDEAIPRPGVARVLSLGHTEWATDVLWINATLYYGESLFARLPMQYVRRYTEVMTTLDPRFRQAYLWGALAMTYRTVANEPDEVRAAARLLQQGLAAFPGDPELRGQLGVFLAIELAPILPRNSDEHSQVRAEAAEHLRRATASGWGGPWEGLFTARLLAESGRLDPAIELLRDLLSRCDNLEARRAIEERLQSYFRQRGGVDSLGEMLRSFENERRTRALWMNPTLFVFVGHGVLDRREDPTAAMPTRVGD